MSDRLRGDGLHITKQMEAYQRRIDRDAVLIVRGQLYYRHSHSGQEPSSYAGSYVMPSYDDLQVRDRRFQPSCEVCGTFEDVGLSNGAWLCGVHI